MSTITPEILSYVAKRLDKVGLNYAFVGGSIVSFLLDHVELSPVRPTYDLDIIVEVMASERYSDIEAKLRAEGFSNDMREGAPMCRWVLDGLTIDIMPTEGTLIGLNADLFHEALASASGRQIGEYRLRIISPAAFIAIKLSAFADRGNWDFYGSRDIEDIMTVIDGREYIVEELMLADARVKEHVATSFREIVNHPQFREALPAFLAADEASQARLPGLIQKIEKICRL